MVKKILNWTGSGIFRTLGRTIAYVLIGLLVSFILNKIGFKLPSIFAMQVNASELQSWATNESRIVMDDHGSSSFTSWQSNPYTFNSLSYPVKNAQFRLRTSDGFSADNTYTFTLQYVPTPDSLSVQSITFFKDGDLSNTETSTCSTWYRSTSGLYSTECSFQPHSNYTSSQYLWVGLTFSQSYQNSVTLGVSKYDERLGVNAVITNQTNIINNSLNSLIEQNNSNTQAIIDSNKSCQFIDKKNITTPNSYLGGGGNVYSGNYVGVTDFIKINSSDTIKVLSVYNNAYVNSCFYDTNKVVISCFADSTMVVDSLLTIPTNVSYFRATIYTPYNQPTFELCKNGTQAVTDTLEDDNVDGDSNDMADFLNDFTFEKDGSISSILTLPITFVENVFEGSYTDDLCFTFRGVQSCLPNGKILWQRSGRHDNLLVGFVGTEQINALKTFFQLVVGGYICYKLLMGIVRTYNTAIDPTIDMSVVMKL